MIEVEFRWIGDTEYAGQMNRRGRTEQLTRAAFVPWEKHLLRRRIPEMYRNRGRVQGPGGRRRWSKNRRATIRKKGHDKPMIAKGGIRPDSMAKSYKIRRKRRGLTAWAFFLTNTARSRSPYSKGFDYPSHLQLGGLGRFTVRPRDDGPGFLAWQDADGTWNRALVTRPRRPRARPHMEFLGRDLDDLNIRTADWILHRRKHTATRRAR